MLVDDLARDPQPEAGALALRLRGEERLEDPRQRLGRDTRTIVGHPHDDPRALDRRRDRDPTNARPSGCRAAGQRLLRVLDQVGPYLVELVDVHRDTGEPAEPAFDDDITQRV